LRKKEKVQKLLPNLFQDDLFCAGSKFGRQGSCKGDSGGPVMTQDVFSKKWTQIGIVEAGIGDCGDTDYPGVYIRLNHPLVLEFINYVLKKG
jgi:secreted trypsin-like serine protease